MSDCTHDCSSCGESCGERTAPQDFRAPANGLSHIGKVIAVVSGKGGVGKSLVTSSLAVAMRRMGKTVGVLDADITGPSIPAAFGVHTKAEGSELGIYPAETKTGIEIMSLNLLTENETDPVVWRGPVIAGPRHTPRPGFIEVGRSVRVTSLALMCRARLLPIALSLHHMLVVTKFLCSSFPQNSAKAL